MAEPRIKGFAVIHVRTMLDEQLGAGWFDEAARDHDPNWPARLLPGDWYSVWTHNHVMTRAHAALRYGGSFEDLIASVAGQTATQDLNGILGAFLWVATPRMFLRTANRIWDTYADFTNLADIQNDAGLYCVQVTEIPAGLVEWVSGCWRGFLPPALELVGAEDVSAKIVDVALSPGHDTWQLRLRMTYR